MAETSVTDMFPALGPDAETPSTTTGAPRHLRTWSARGYRGRCEEALVFLDDKDMCVAGARVAGIHAVRYPDNAQAIEEIEKLITTT
jgi:hypothetical protein